ncbi:MAG: Holliday junction resolvase RuvX [Candidatus Acidiferrales bacterium]
MATSRKIHAPAAALRTRILAVDYGRKRIGLAISDEKGLTARPLATLTRTNRRNDLRRLREIAREHGVARILVGHPLNLDGTAGEMAAEAARFAGRIRKELGLPVELADERLSTWEAEQMHGARPRRRQRQAPVDAVAAAVILRDYLERREAKKGNAEARASRLSSSP